MGKLFKFVLGRVVIDHGGIRHLRCGTVVVIGMGKLVTGADALHPQVFVGADGVAGAQTAHQQHHLFAIQAGLVFIDDGLHDRVILGDHFFYILLDSVVKALGNGPQALADLGGAEEVKLQPGDAEFLFHDLAHVVHGAVAVDQVQLDLMSGGDLFQFAVAGPDRLDVQTDLFQQCLGRPDIATDIVVADQRDVVWRGRFGKLTGLDDVVTDRIVGNMVSQ